MPGVSGWWLIARSWGLGFGVWECRFFDEFLNFPGLGLGTQMFRLLGQLSVLAGWEDKKKNPKPNSGARALGFGADARP